MFRILTGVFLLLALVVSGCSSLGCGDPHPYINSPSRAPLKAPEGLTIPSPDAAYVIGTVPPATGKHPDRNAAGVCLIYPPQVVPLASPAKPAAPKAPSGAQATPQPGTAAPATKAGASQTPAPAAATSTGARPWLARIGGMQ